MAVFHGNSMKIIMFKQRIITVIFLVPIVVLAVFYSNNVIFKIITGLLVMLCGFEWLQLIPVKSFLVKISLFYLLCLSMWLAGIVFNYWLFFGICLLSFILIFICLYPKYEMIWGHKSV